MVVQRGSMILSQVTQTVRNVYSVGQGELVMVKDLSLFGMVLMTQTIEQTACYVILN